MHHDHFGKPYDKQSSGGGDKGLQYVSTSSELFYEKQDNCVNEEVGRCHTMKP